MVWNMRRMNHTTKKHEIMRVVERMEIDILGMVETKIRRRKTLRRTFFEWKWGIVSNSWAVEEMELDLI